MQINITSTFPKYFVCKRSSNSNKKEDGLEYVEQYMSFEIDEVTTTTHPHFKLTATQQGGVEATLVEELKAGMFTTHSLQVCANMYK